MRTVLSGALTLALFVSPSFAQGTGPGQSTGQFLSKVLTFGTNGNVPFVPLPGNFAFFRLPGDPPGTWTAVLAGGQLLKKWGGTGRNDLLIGKWNRVTGTFTPTLQAKALNSTGDDDTLMIDERTGRYAIFERNDGFWFSMRTSPKLPFPAPVKVLGLVVGFFKDFNTPALGWVGGKLKIFWNNGGLYMADLDITNPAKPKVPPKSQWQLISSGGEEVPVPLTGPDGDVEGLVVRTKGSGETDLGFLNDLNPKTPIFPLFDTTNFVDGGGIAGSLVVASDRPKPSAANMQQVSWLLGDREKPGGKVDIFGATAKLGANAPVTVILFAANPIKPFQVPGMKGAFGLDLLTLGVLGIMTHPNPSEHGSLSFGLPNNPAFKGIIVALQGLSVDPLRSTLTLTNTAWLEVL